MNTDRLELCEYNEIRSRWIISVIRDFPALKNWLYIQAASKQIDH